MKALGMIETIGLVGAIEAADTALKTAEVEIVNRHIVKGGIVTVELSGDVGAIKVAVEAGAEAAKRLGVFVSSHVIARPDEMVSKMIEENSIIVAENITEEITEVIEEKELEKEMMEIKEEIGTEETEIIEKSVDTLTEKPIIKENKSKRK
ncbi:MULTISPECIES: BMC domain-containing protein [Fusobacterium]|jgi:microcompartment protein CcmL/EutN|uniref:BMC domain-containing protein n=1 Tax=Fusobacterium varium ATCC 27725 TaxID=469618 RepID=A0ABM6U3I6_FUSVA|nr:MULTISPECIES: BMC domain-containing protein [Fusobacterium]AVQ30874.1 BMC domain-containing protein [Fusobacterium varium ATCC 27725]EES63685.1 BMC domain protein [Fusobacterium varium ATCC 27725]MCF2672121.1 BMC domain-containing protein [Fusobacterium varium]VEH40482.1 Major carboxysome shell protein 1A [Fusobacterium varium]HBJ79408.1 BMC domain-containing protein [Fusobacterium sp.]